MAWTRLVALGMVRNARILGNLWVFRGFLVVLFSEMRNTGREEIWRSSWRCPLDPHLANDRSWHHPSPSSTVCWITGPMAGAVQPFCDQEEKTMRIAIPEPEDQHQHPHCLFHGGKSIPRVYTTRIGLSGICGQNHP